MCWFAYKGTGLRTREKVIMFMDSLMVIRKIKRFHIIL